MGKKAESLLYVFIYIAVNIAVQIITAIIIPAFSALQKYTEWRILRDFIAGLQNSSMNVATTLLISSIISLLIFRGILAVRRIKVGVYIKTHGLGMQDIVSAALLAFGLSVAAQLITSLPVFEPFTEDYNRAMDTIMSGNLWYLFFTVGVAAPIFEELMYRALILGELSRSFSFFCANLIHSLVFGIMHANVIQGIYAALIGFVLGLVYKKRGSIYTVVLVHIFFNAGSVLLTGYIGANLSFPYYPAAGAISLLLGWFILKRSAYT